MTDQERMKRIEQLIAERDIFKPAIEAGDYASYDERTLILNDEGHIDWMVNRIKELESFQKQFHENMFGN